MGKLTPTTCFSILRLMSFVLVFQPVLAQHKENLHREISRILKNEDPVDFSIVPSVVILTWDGDFMVVDTFGQQIPGDDGHDYFEWGGLTQPVIAYLVESILQTYRLTPDSFLFSLMPNHLQDPKWKSITYRQMLEHRAGLPTFPAAMGSIEKDVADPYRDFDLAALDKEMQDIHLTPGEFNYSNLGYAFLYWLFDPMEGYQDYAEHFFSNMDGREMDFSFECNEACLTPGHRLNGKPALPWNTNALQPALGLEGSLTGMYNFIQLWREEYMDEIPSLSELKKGLKENAKTKSYLMYHGWFAVKSGKSALLYHTGHTGGHQVSAAFLPKENKGVLIFSNGEAGSHDLCFSILTMLQRAKQKKHER